MLVGIGAGGIRFEGHSEVSFRFALLILHAPLSHRERTVVRVNSPGLGSERRGRRKRPVGEGPIGMGEERLFDREVIHEEVRVIDVDRAGDQCARMGQYPSMGEHAHMCELYGLCESHCPSLRPR